ncbi:hypothetical protein BTN49_2536 [Candidatus Enterovibrio escicola]|uniref:Uncharacterized protein n=1 Tax=Candidatus Enterovibrio escicola TaxID=1927127 RepID=A0A2A5T148_9GAMM|nr:hypothetical protein BTN49_2536 [Candidatus Enterovibrio escacola]
MVRQYRLAIHRWELNFYNICIHHVLSALKNDGGAIYSTRQ